MIHQYGSDRQDAAPLREKTRPLTIKDLPPPGTTRWVVRRKAAVVMGVRQGLISLEEACQRYTLSVEEFLSWQRLIEEHGERGLRVTRLKEYRPTTAAE
ncbi:MAG: CtrA inhibitor SciP [Alphaproteobacteria bacterium]